MMLKHMLPGLRLATRELKMIQFAIADIILCEDVSVTMLALLK